MDEEILHYLNDIEVFLDEYELNLKITGKSTLQSTMQEFYFSKDLHNRSKSIRDRNIKDYDKTLISRFNNIVRRIEKIRIDIESN